MHTPRVLFQFFFAVCILAAEQFSVAAPILDRYEGSEHVHSYEAYVYAYVPALPLHLVIATTTESPIPGTPIYCPVVIFADERCNAWTVG